MLIVALSVPATQMNRNLDLGVCQAAADALGLVPVQACGVPVTHVECDLYLGFCQAAADALGLEPGQACGSVSPTREMLGRFIQQHFPVLRETAKNAGGMHMDAV